MLRLWVIFCLSLLVITGCAKQGFRGPKAYKDKLGEQNQNLVHTVKFPGETLALIAEWYTGSTANWKEIAKFNPNLNPNLIRLGDQIKIPAHLIKKTDPLPKPRPPRVEARQPTSKPEQPKEPQSAAPKHAEQVKKNAEDSTTKPANSVEPARADTEEKQPKTQAQDSKEPADQQDSRERIRKELLKELLE